MGAREADRQAGRQKNGYIETDRETEIGRDRQASRQTCTETKLVEAGRQTDSERDRDWEMQTRKRRYTER